MIKRSTIILFFLLLFVVTTPTVQAQTVKKEATISAAVMATTSAQATDSAKEEYQLPYAGLLPDHPLYILKTLRDRIIEVLITDPVEKARFYVVCADKRLATVIALVDKGNHQLAETTASKAEEYLAKAVTQIAQGEKEGKDTTAMTLKLQDALVKHETVLSELAGKTEGGIKDRFNQMSANARKYRESFQTK